MLSTSLLIRWPQLTFKQECKIWIPNGWFSKYLIWKKKDKFPTEFSKPIIFNTIVQRSGDYA